jgi:hypothetical protein
MTVLAHFTAHRIPAYYVPHQFEVREIEVRHLYRQESARAESARPPAPKAGGGPMLPPIVHTYTRGELLTLCQGLELRAPPHNTDKAGIIEHIEKQLRTLARSAARG